MVIIIFKVELMQKKLKPGFRAYWQGQSEKKHQWAAINVKVIIIAFINMKNPIAISSDILFLLSSLNVPLSDAIVGKNVFQE